MSEMSDEYKQWLRNTQVKQISKAIEACATQVFWRNEHNELRNGTITCISKDDQIYGITADHVAEACIKSYNSDPERTCQIGAANFNPSEMLISRHESYDLASFHISKPFAAIAGIVPTKLLSWPPVTPEKGDLVIFGGYPGANRQDRGGTINFDFVIFGGNLDSASDRNIGMVLNIETSLSTSPKRMPPNADLGGWSGGPAFRITESPLSYIEVIGVIYEYSHKSEIVLARPLVLVESEGMLVSQGRNKHE
ncbi:hypothetical protein ACFL30_01100 [Candidatus Latescibacterota bacterium]